MSDPTHFVPLAWPGDEADQQELSLVLKSSRMTGTYTTPVSAVDWRVVPPLVATTFAHLSTIMERIVELERDLVPGVTPFGGRVVAGTLQTLIPPRSMTREGRDWLRARAAECGLQFEELDDELLDEHDLDHERLDRGD